MILNVIIDLLAGLGGQLRFLVIDGTILGMGLLQSQGMNEVANDQQVPDLVHRVSRSMSGGKDGINALDNVGCALERVHMSLVGIEKPLYATVPFPGGLFLF